MANSKMITLGLVRVRVDYGNECFGDALIPTEVQLDFITGTSISDVSSKLKDFVKSRNGQIIESSGDSIIFDTTDLTWTVSVTNEELSHFNKVDLANQIFEVARTL